MEIEQNGKRKKKWYKKWWVIVIIIIAIVLLIGIFSGGKTTEKSFKEGFEAGIKK